MEVLKVKMLQVKCFTHNTPVRFPQSHSDEIDRNTNRTCEDKIYF